MTAAFKVSYIGPNGPCPDCVIPFDSSSSECVAVYAKRIKKILIRARANSWRSFQVTITAIEYNI